MQLKYETEIEKAIDEGRRYPRLRLMEEGQCINPCIFAEFHCFSRRRRIAILAMGQMHLPTRRVGDTTITLKIFI